MKIFLRISCFLFVSKSNALFLINTVIIIFEILLMSIVKEKFYFTMFSNK